MFDVKDRLHGSARGADAGAWCPIGFHLGTGSMAHQGTAWRWHCLMQVRSEAHARTLPLKVLRLAEPRQNVPSYVPAR